ncbi:hypothetical protein QFC21_004464 [Naganishia friedmannii]|uniref:Uncharacterized protein n=1 Tax=Naganishia friedmannii TaxID=89922 RepID=A0ACC2VG97_9TREE|nr:hypothetical protein QFC21_004464 [Naganishia friedmannii]
MAEESRNPSQPQYQSLPLSVIDYNQQANARSPSDWTATKTPRDQSESIPTHSRPRSDPATANTPPNYPADIDRSMASLSDEDDMLFEVDFDTETLQQMSDVYQKHRFPSDEEVQSLAAQAASRMGSSEEETSQVDEPELQRKVREWFSKERTKDAKNGKPLPTPGTMSPKQNSFNSAMQNHPFPGGNLSMPPAFGNLGLTEGHPESPSTTTALRQGGSTDNRHDNTSQHRNGEQVVVDQVQQTMGNGVEGAIDPDLAGLPSVPGNWEAATSSARDTARILDFDHGIQYADGEMVVDPDLMDVPQPPADDPANLPSPTTLISAIAAAHGGEMPAGYSNADRMSLSLGAAFEHREGQKMNGNGFETGNADLGVDDETKTQVDSQGSGSEKPEIDLVAWLRKSYNFLPPPHLNNTAPTVLREDLYTQMARDLPSSCPLPSKDQVAALVVKAFPQATWESSVTEGPVYAVRGLVKKAGANSKHRYTKSCNLSDLADVALNRELTASTEAENASNDHQSPPESASASLVTGTPRRSALDDLAHAAGLVEQSPMEANGQFATLEDAVNAARNEGLALKKRRMTATSSVIVSPQMGPTDDPVGNADWQATGWSTSQGNPYNLGWPHDTTLHSVVSQFQTGEDLPPVPNGSDATAVVGPVKRKRASTKGNSKRAVQQNSAGLLPPDGESSSRMPSAQAGPSSSRSSSAKGKQKKPIYTNQANVSSTDPNVKHYKPNFTYHELITHEIKRSAEGRLQLSEIYRRISERYPYFKLGEPGWQNSIRHNLSLKKCFVRVDRPSDNAADKAGKGGWWTYNPGTDADGRPGRKGLSGKGTGEYRKGSTPSDIASRSGSREREMEAEENQNAAAAVAVAAASMSGSTSATPQMLPHYPAFQFDQNTIQQGL